MKDKLSLSSPAGLRRFFHHSWWATNSLFWWLMVASGFVMGYAVNVPTPGWTLLGLILTAAGTTVLAAWSHVRRHELYNRPLEYNGGLAMRLTLVFSVLSVLFAILVDLHTMGWALTALGSVLLGCTFAFFLIWQKNRVVYALVCYRNR